MCELQSQLVACKVCSAENKRLRARVEELEIELHTDQVCFAEARSLLEFWEAEAKRLRALRPEEPSEW